MKSGCHLQIAIPSIFPHKQPRIPNRTVLASCTYKRINSLNAATPKQANTGKMLRESRNDHKKSTGQRQTTRNGHAHRHSSINTPAHLLKSNHGPRTPLTHQQIPQPPDPTPTPHVTPPYDLPPHLRPTTPLRRRLRLRHPLRRPRRPRPTFQNHPRQSPHRLGEPPAVKSSRDRSRQRADRIRVLDGAGAGGVCAGVCG